MYSEAEIRVATVIAPRIGLLLKDRNFAVIHAPREYLPKLVITEALSARYGADGYETVHIPGGTAAEIQAGLTATRPLLIDVHTTDPAVLQPIFEEVIATHLPPAIPSTIILVVEADEFAWGEVLGPDFAFSHQLLAMTRAELALVHPEATDGSMLGHRVMAVTGGVPALVAVGRPQDDDYVDRVVSASAGWAARIAGTISANPVLASLGRGGRLADETVTELASALAGEPIDHRQVQQARLANFLTSIDAEEPSMPAALAIAGREHCSRNIPEQFNAVTQQLRDIGMTHSGLTGLQQLELLSNLGEWDAVDELLASKMHLLVLLSRAQRHELRELWPKSAPRRLRRIAHARQYLEGRAPLGAAPDTPGTWVEFAYLLLAEDVTDSHDLTSRMRPWFTDLVMRGRPLSRTESDEVLGEIVSALLEGAADLETVSPRHHPDDTAMLVGVMQGAADAALLAGQLTQALNLIRTATRLAFSLGPVLRHYGTLQAGLYARNALVAAVGGSLRAASSWLEEYESVAVPDEPMQEAIASMARRYVSTRAEKLSDDTSIMPIDVDRPLAPQMIEAEALRVAVLHGPVVATDWVRTMINRATWDQRQEWEWWPLYAVQAMLDALSGRPAMAQTVIDRVWLPPALSVTVRAMVQYAAGQSASALTLADEVLHLPDVATRWRLLAMGVRLACLTELPERAVELDGLLASEHWEDMLGIVVLFPDPARKLVLDRLPPKVHELPGFVGSCPAEEPVNEDAVSLTPRQLEILAELSGEGTMQEIANRMFISVETVRSTSKELYRRLGVRGREAAVQVGRVRGLIS